MAHHRTLSLQLAPASISTTRLFKSAQLVFSFGSNMSRISKTSLGELRLFKLFLERGFYALVLGFEFFKRGRN